MKRKKSIPEKEVVPSNKWWCSTCKSSEMTQPEMIAHLQSVHALDTKNLKCQKKMVMHMDGADWFSYQWEVFPVGTEIKLINSTVSKRSAEDAAYWL